MSHFGPEGNLFDKQLELFQSCSRSGSVERLLYIHDADEAQCYAQELGTFAPWEPLSQDTDLLFYVLTPKPSVECKLNLKGLIDGIRITGFNTLVILGGQDDVRAGVDPDRAHREPVEAARATGPRGVLSVRGPWAAGAHRGTHPV